MISHDLDPLFVHREDFNVELEASYYLMHTEVISDICTLNCTLLSDYISSTIFFIIIRIGII